MGAPWATVQGRCQILVTSVKTWGRWRMRSGTHLGLVAPSHSLSLCLFHVFLHLTHSPTRCLACQLFCMPNLRPPPLPSRTPSLAPLTGRALVLLSDLWGQSPAPHPSYHSLKLHPWVTRHGAEPLPSEDENCTLVEVTEEEVENSVKHIPSLATVVRQNEPLTENRDSLRRACKDGPGHRRAAEKQILSLRVGMPGSVPDSQLSGSGPWSYIRAGGPCPL